MAIVVVPANDGDELDLLDFAVELLGDDLRLGADAAGSVVRLLLVLAVAKDEDLEHFSVDNHRLNEDVLVLTGLEAPLVQDCVDAMIAQ